jgi:3',5'-cyclic AMP phosphodiesterase CpdA
MRIAHLSDMHLLEPTERPGFGARFVSLGRRLDAEGRLDKARAAITHARASGAEHYLFTGDLTETGTPAQFEALAALLAECNLRDDEVTLLPGNHDAYTSENGWRDALEGPLRPWAAKSDVVELGDAIILPVDATFHQPVTRSAARLTEDLEHALEARLSDPALSRERVIVAIHHPPHPRPGPWHWVDGLLGCKRLLAMIERRENVTVMHGHLHRAQAREHGVAHVIGAAAIVDGALPECHGERRRAALVA